MTQSPFAPFEMDFTKFFGEFKAPALNFDALMQSHQKTVETLTEANRKAFESMQQIIKRNTEIMQTSLQHMQEMMNQLVAEGTPEEKVAKQADLMKNAFDKSLANIKEIAGMMIESNTEYADTINTRISSLLAELKDMIDMAKVRAAGSDGRVNATSSAA